jgi:TAG lipase/steryl ester hydrolase/phospholipase A2/LPA acyltransferase
MGYHSLKEIEHDMAHASSFEAWRAAGLEHDRLSGAAEWKLEDASPDYDYPLVRMRLNELRQARVRQDVEQIIFILNEGLHGNLGNIANPVLYQVAKVGSKRLIREYLDEVTDSLNYLCDLDHQRLPLDEKITFFRNSSQAFGSTALMLSGGAGLGLFHIGVIKALWEQQLLPRVLSGSSAGSIVASVLGTHTDAELLEIFDPKYLQIEAFKMVGWKGLLRGRPLLRGDYLEACLDKNVADLTFDEAFQRTGRLINIPVSPADSHQNPRVLNAKTSPNVLVRKAALASCAIPGIFPSVTLWAKNAQGEKVPYIPSRKWVDGSLKFDLPLSRLSRLYGINHSIVSQTNPHVLPFLARDGEIGEWGKKISRLVLGHLNITAQFVLGEFRDRVQHDGGRLLLDKLQSVLSQRYIGDINIFPPRKPTSFLRILKNPSAAEIEQFIVMGEHAAWPKIEQVRNSTQISRTFEKCLDRLALLEKRELKRSSDFKPADDSVVARDF